MGQTDPRILVAWALAIPIDAVVAQVNAGEDDFTETVLDEASHFIRHFLKGPAREVGPYMRDHTETAPQQAPILHLHISAASLAEARDAGRHVGHAEAAQQIGQFPFVG